MQKGEKIISYPFNYKMISNKNDLRAVHYHQIHGKGHAVKSKVPELTLVRSRGVVGK